MQPASRHLARLGAVSRPSGSAAADEARLYSAGVLRELGFSTSEHPFEYSAFPGAWAAPVAGLILPALATILYFTRSGDPAWLVIAGLTVFTVAGLLAHVGGSGVLELKYMRRRGVNLSAVRGDGTRAGPLVWLVAHIDSKWQPVSMIARVAGVIVLCAASIALIAVAVFGWPGGPAAVIAMWIGAIPLMASVVGDRNHGALDNASGVAAVLEAAALVPREARVGVLITDAEELALAGARVWARDNKPAIALNCDSVDDSGDLIVMYTRSAPDEVVSAIRRAALEQGEPLKAFRLIPGILTDSVALTAAGWPAVTLSRGTARTLQRIHTTRDTLAHMDGRGIAGAARVLARTATELAEWKS